MKAEELKDIVEKALSTFGDPDILVDVEKTIPSVEDECFHIRLQGDVFMCDLNAIVEATGDRNIIIDSHPLGGLDIFCCIKNKE